MIISRPLLSNRNLQNIIPFAVFLFVTIPLVVLAQTSPQGSSPTGGLVPCTNNCNFNDLTTLINNIINWFLGISVSVAAITFAIAGGIMLFNPNNPGKRGEALEMFKKTIIGIIIILVAWLVIHTVIAALVNQNTGALRFLGN